MIIGQLQTKFATTALAVGLATAAVVGGSSALWSAQTTNPGNSVAAGTFVLTNDKDTASIFTAATGARPGSTGNGTATLTNGSNTPMAISLAQVNESTSNALSGALKLKIENGGNCVYPVAGVGACASFGAWEGGATLDTLSLGTVAAGASTALKATWEFPSDVTGTTGQGQAASFDLQVNGTQS